MAITAYLSTKNVEIPVKPNYIEANIPIALYIEPLVTKDLKLPTKRDFKNT